MIVSPTLDTDSTKNTNIKVLPHFWSHAKCTHSLKRYDPGCAKYRAIYGEKFIRLRRYRDLRTGERKKTVEHIPCCADCNENGAYDEDKSDFTYDEVEIHNKELDRDEAEENGECRIGFANGSGCYIFICKDCNKKTNLVVMDAC